MRPSHPVLLLLALSGCSFADGDLADTSAVTDLSVEASNDALGQRSTTLTGTITLGYTSSQLVEIQVLDNGVEVWRGSHSADKLEVPIDATVDLLFQGSNTLTVQASYDGDDFVTTTNLVVPAPLQSFSFEAESGVVDVPMATISGEAKLGFTSDDPAVLRVWVNGVSVLTRSVDTNKAKLSFDEQVILPSEGVNTIEAKLSYQGAAMADSFEVTLPAGMQSLEVTRSTVLIPGPTPQATRSAEVAIGAQLGYASDLPVDVWVWVVGALAVHPALDAPADGVLDQTYTVALPSVGDNVIAVDVSYGDTTLSDTGVVSVAPSIGSFTMVPSAAVVDVFEADITGSVNLGYTSDQPVTLLVWVDGAQVVTKTMSAASLSNLALNATVPLSHTGDSVITTEVRYDGASFVKDLSVSMMPPTPTVVLPNWNEQSYDFDGKPKRVDGPLTVVPGSGWQTESVAFSTDGGITWLQGSSPVGNLWDVQLVNPAIATFPSGVKAPGIEPVVFKITASNRGIDHDFWFYDEADASIDFSCTTAGRVEPTADMARNNKFETRVFKGYFGSGHDLAFTVSFTDKDGNDFDVVGSLVQASPLSATVTFNVDQADCNNSACDYDLELFIDGQSFCRQSGFAQIKRY